MADIPQKIDKYEIKREIGRGGMAIVYLGYDPILERNVAVKILPEYFKHNPEFIKRFKREAISVSKLRHANIVTVFDADIQENIPFIVMELLPGGSLEELIKQEGKLPLYLVVKLSMEVSDALDIAHKNGIIHRDIKPSNILFAKDGHAVITDFGIAKALTGTKLTTTGQTLGTPEHMAPEIIQGALETSFDIRSDIYSLGIVMYEMLTGELPFKGDTPLSVAFQQVNKKPIPIRDKNPSVPLSLARIVEKCLNKKPEERYQTAEELYSNLSNIINSYEISSTKSESEKILEKFVKFSVDKLFNSLPATTKPSIPTQETHTPSNSLEKIEQPLASKEIPEKEKNTEEQTEEIKTGHQPPVTSRSAVSEEVTINVEKEEPETEIIKEKKFEIGEERLKKTRPVFSKSSIIIPVVLALIAIPLIFFIARSNTNKEGSETAISTPAYLSITSEPTDAKVYIDNKYIGNTPVNEYIISIGTHALKLTKEGYEDYTTTVNVTTDSTANVNVHLNVSVGWSAVNSGLSNTYVFSLAIDPSNNQVIYAGTNGCVFKSTNGGLIWNAMNNGLICTDFYSLAIDPTNTEVIYVGSGVSTIFKSINGGLSWSNSGFANSFVFSLAIDPTATNIIYAGIEGGGVFKSTNGGSSWSAVNSGLGIGDVRSLVIDPNNSQVIYAGIEGGGVFKSTNGGSSWSAVNSGLSNLYVNSLAIDPKNSQVIYAGTYGGVFKSTNGGSSWSAVNNGLDDLNVFSLAIDPKDSQVIYAGTYGGGVFKSTNGGSSWSAVNSGLDDLNVFSLAIDPKDSQVIYAGTYGGGVFKSTNGGSSWSAVNSGLGNGNVYSLAIDPNNSQVIYAGTWGGGVFKTQP